MDKVLTTILLVVASIVAVVMVINAVYPATTLSSSALSGVSARMGDRMRSQMSIIHVAGELDKDGVWQDINSDNEFDVFLWVKNIGTATIVNIENSDLFIGNTGNWTRVAHKDWAVSLPSWEYSIENGSEWGQSSTITVEVSYSSPLSPGEYKSKIIAPNGVSEEYYFSM